MSISPPPTVSIMDAFKDQGLPPDQEVMSTYEKFCNCICCVPQTISGCANLGNGPRTISSVSDRIDCIFGWVYCCICCPCICMKEFCDAVFPMPHAGAYTSTNPTFSSTTHRTHTITTRILPVGSTPGYNYNSTYRT